MYIPRVQCLLLDIIKGCFLPCLIQYLKFCGLFQLFPFPGNSAGISNLCRMHLEPMLSQRLVTFPGFDCVGIGRIFILTLALLAKPAACLATTFTTNSCNSEGRMRSVGIRARVGRHFVTKAQFRDRTTTEVSRCESNLTYDAVTRSVGVQAWRTPAVPYYRCSALIPLHHIPAADAPSSESPLSSSSPSPPLPDSEGMSLFIITMIATF